MSFKLSRKIVFIICIGGVIAVAVFIINMIPNRQVYLYAWERPEDFSFLNVEG